MKGKIAIIQATSQINKNKLDNELLQKMLSKKDVISFVLANGTDCDIAKWLRGMHDDGN